MMIGCVYKYIQFTSEMIMTYFRYKHLRKCLRNWPSLWISNNERCEVQLAMPCSSLYMHFSRGLQNSHCSTMYSGTLPILLVKLLSDYGMTWAFYRVLIRPIHFQNVFLVSSSAVITSLSWLGSISVDDF